MEVRDWMRSLKAADVMTTHVVSLRESTMLADAAHLFVREQLSGAPVVDADGRCVGVLSVTDVVGAEERVAREQEVIADSGYWSSPLALPQHLYAEQLAAVRDKLVPAAEQPVGRFMTRDLVSVAEDAPLVDLIHHMVEAHIHRIVVLADDRRLVGMVTTTDILAALLRASR